MSRGALAAVAATAALVVGTTGWSQTTTQTARTIKLPPQTTTQITLTLNESVGLEFPTPIKRAAIANDQIASVSVVSPKLVLVTGQSLGFTQLVLWDETDEQHVYDIRVNIDVKRLAQTLADAAPRADIEVSSILDTVILKGTVPDAPTGKRLVELAKAFSSNINNQLTVAGVQQVMLRATVAEISREAIRELGFNATFFGADAFAGSNLNLINPTSIGLQEQTLVPIGPPNRFQIMGGELAVNPTTTLYFGLPRTQLEGFIRAVEENNLLRVLAEPNLVAISGHEAEFLAGGEYPVPVPTEDGLAIMFREYGVMLRFTPVVQDGQIIRVAVVSEVSEPDFTNAVQIAGLTIPGLTKRRTQTMVEVGSGQTFAIAGLLSESVRGIATRVPGVGSLPVIGALFRSVNYQRAESELVVMITPELVSPLNKGQVDYVAGMEAAPPNDWQLYGLGLIEDDSYTPTTTRPAQAPNVPPAPLCGPWGPQISTSNAEPQ
ncbi:MAG: type II and III secretion system protein family protein [Phycisphaerae bacterium]|nr:type II and III secretion system protein family protein [Phycisphaerae bacterium]